MRKPGSGVLRTLAVAGAALLALSLAAGAWAQEAPSPPALRVTALSGGPGEYRFYFQGGAFPYVLRLWEATREKDGKPEIWLRGLGLRGPWFENPSYPNAWYMNQFMDVNVNGTQVLYDPQGFATTTLFDRCEVLDAGPRCLVEYLWKRKAADVRLRFLLRPDCPALLAELLLEPKLKLDRLEIPMSAFPGAYTNKGEGDRRMVTALREEKCPVETEVDPAKEGWMLFCDAKLDLALPINRRTGAEYSGGAGLYVLPQGVEKVKVKLETYPVYATLLGAPDATRLRFAVQELPFPNADAAAKMKEAWPTVQKLLQEETFRPRGLTSFDPAKEAATLQVVGRSPQVPPEYFQATVTALDAAVVAVKALAQTAEKPITVEQQAQDAVQAFRRRTLTAQRYARPLLRVFEGRGPGYSHWQLAEALQRLGEGKSELAGGYMSIGGQGRGVTPFPGTVEDLYQYDAVVLLDVDARALAAQQLSLLQQYVQDGGGLLVCGGLYAYAAGDYPATSLHALLPLQAKPGAVFDKRPGGAQKLKLVTAKPVFTGFTWPANLACPWYHDLQPGPGAQIVATLGAAPWLASSTPGAGRALACAGTILGEAPTASVAFSGAPQWPDALLRMVRWLGRK